MNCSNSRDYLVFFSEEKLVIDFVYFFCLVIVYLGIFLESGYYYCYVCFLLQLIVDIEIGDVVCFRISDQDIWCLFNDSCVFYLVYSLFFDVFRWFFKDIFYVLIYKWVSRLCYFGNFVNYEF